MWTGWENRDMNFENLWANNLGVLHYIINWPKLLVALKASQKDLRRKSINLQRKCKWPVYLLGCCFHLRHALLTQLVYWTSYLNIRACVEKSKKGSHTRSQKEAELLWAMQPAPSVDISSLEIKWVKMWGFVQCISALFGLTISFHPLCYMLVLNVYCVLITYFYQAHNILSNDELTIV